MNTSLRTVVRTVGPTNFGLGARQTRTPRRPRRAPSLVSVSVWLSASLRARRLHFAAPMAMHIHGGPEASLRHVGTFPRSLLYKHSECWARPRGRRVRLRSALSTAFGNFLGPKRTPIPNPPEDALDSAFPGTKTPRVQPWRLSLRGLQP